MKTKKSQPVALFDDIKNIDENHQYFSQYPEKMQQDCLKALAFLKSYRGSQGTFNSYRREVERLLQWAFFIADKTLAELKREDIEEYLKFCCKPPKSWIGIHKPTRFIEKEGKRIPNPAWRPFIVTLSKSAHKKGEDLDIDNFEFKNSSMKELFAILGSFYQYLLQEEYVYMNPIALIRQKSQFIRKQQGPDKIRRLSDLQWQTVLKTAYDLAEAAPTLHERTLFIMKTLYAMYLRISELSANDRWIPMMNHFRCDSDGNWWFTTVGKGNKQRDIAVSDAMLEALKRWRKYLGLTTLPSPSDNTPLIPKNKGKGAVSSVHHIREIVQNCFNQAISKLKQEGHESEAELLGEATVHWLRHTGISDDVKMRPREHVRDDAGHSSGATTDKYIDIELKERHRTAKNKPLNINEEFT